MRETFMTISVKVGEAKTRLSELLAKVEAGEEVIISRGDQPIAKLMRLTQGPDVQAAIDQIFASRAGREPTTAEEIRAWRDEGQRY